MGRTKQQSFEKVSDEFSDYWKKTKRKVHGGLHSKGKRKTARPFDSRKPIHLVLGASIAKGPLSMASPLNKSRVDTIVHEYAFRNGVKVYDYSNNGNHLHLCVKAHSHAQFKKYLRTITGLIPRIIMKAKKGKPKGKFWNALAFTRVGEWGKAYGTLKKYIFRNILEAAGIIPYDRDGYRFIDFDSTA